MEFNEGWRLLKGGVYWMVAFIGGKPLGVRIVDIVYITRYHKNHILINVDATEKSSLCF